MLKHEEMIENVHRRIAQYEEEKKMKHPLFKNNIKPDTTKEETRIGEDGYIEFVSSTERVEKPRRILRTVSAVAAAAVLVTGLGATGVLLSKHKQDTTKEESQMDEVNVTPTSSPVVIDAPFAGLLNEDFVLEFPHIEFTDTMRQKTAELLNSEQGWKVADNFDRVIHYENGGAWSPFAECIQLISGNYSMRICDDNIIEYAVLEGEYWRKTYYECDTLSLAKGIAGIIDSELKDNGVDFDNDVSDFYYNAGGADIPLSETQKIVLGMVLRSNNWKEEDGQANRFFTFMLDKENVGTLGVVREGGIYFQQDGITYVGDNADSAKDIEYILFNYEYPGAEMEVSLNDADYKEIISINDENRVQFENFVNYDLPSMLVPISINSSANDSPLKYSLSIAYKTGEMEIRTVDFSIHDSGYAERLDYVLDPVMSWAPSGCHCYTIDLAAFEEKLDELKSSKPADKKEETTEAVTEDVQTTTEPQTITMIEKQETSIAPDETIPMSDDDRAYFSTETGIFVFDKNDKLIASPDTHDGIQLEKFALDKFIPMLTSIEENTRFGSDEIPYVIIRKYNAGGNRILRDGYYIYDDGYVSICSYEYMDGDWIPAGCKSFEMNYEEFKSLLDETLNLSELHD